jgi:hypothetical protein
VPPVSIPITTAPIATAPPAEVPAPVPVDAKPEPPEPAPPVVDIKNIELPPMPTSHPTPVPASTHPITTIPDSSIAPLSREIDEPKPVAKVEPRNGLDKVDPSHYIDPIERSLASLERSLNADVPMDVSVGVSESSMRLEEEFSLPKTPMMPDAAHQNLMAQLGGLTEIAHVPEQIKNEMYVPPSHNGFVEKNMQHERELIRPDVNPNIPDIPPIAPVSSIFDPVPSAPHSVIAQSHHSISGTPCLMTPAIKKEEVKPLLTPKPIEDLIGVSNMVTNKMYDRNKYEVDKKLEDAKNSNFVQAFKMKQEQNLKNASSWSSLAQAGSPQSIPNMSTNSQMKQKPVMDSFQVIILPPFKFSRSRSPKYHF